MLRRDFCGVVVLFVYYVAGSFIESVSCTEYTLCVMSQRTVC